MPATPMPTSPRKYVIPSTVLAQELDGEVVLLDLEGEHYFSLDNVGARVWQLLLEHGTEDAIVATMLEEFEVDEATLRADVATLLAELLERRLIA